MFFDDSGRLIPDPDHSEDEDRFILLGQSSEFDFYLFVIAIEKMMNKSGSFQHEKPISLNKSSIKGFKHER